MLKQGPLKKHWPKVKQGPHRPTLILGQIPRTDILKYATTHEIIRGPLVIGAKQYHAAPIDPRYTGGIMTVPRQERENLSTLLVLKTGEFYI